MKHERCRAELLRPYESLLAYDVWALNVLTEPSPDLDDVEDAIAHLCELIEERVDGEFEPSERDIKASIYNGSADLSARYYGLPKLERSGKARAAVGRWLRSKKGGDDGSDTPDQEMTTWLPMKPIKPRRKRDDEAR